MAQQVSDTRLPADLPDSADSEAGPRRVRAAARRPVLRGRALQPGPRPRPHHARVRRRLHPPRAAEPQERRGLHPSPGGHGAQRRRAQARLRHHRRSAAARRRRRHGHPAVVDPGRVRRGDRHARRRRHQADQDALHLPGGGAGRELPQDDHRDGHRHPGHPDQALRPPAQHAHALLPEQAEADPEGQGDARGLRAARAPPRYPQPQVAARGPLVRLAAPAQVPGDPEVGRAAPRRPRGLRRRGGRLPERRAREGRHRRRHHRPRQALLLHLHEDEPRRQGVQRDLRPHRAARAGRLDQGLLRRRGHHPLGLEADPRTVQGLHRDAQVQPVPVAAHDGDRSRRQAAGDPDPHVRHAPDGGVRGRRALALQGARRPRPGQARPGCTR